MAIIVTLPSLGTFGLVWYFSDNLIQAAIAGAVIHFLALGFSFKISKKLLVRKSNNFSDVNS